jgi:hypothetical protein
MNILYIENDIIDIKNCQVLFSDTTHHLKIAHNFEESIPMLLSESIDFVISSRSIETARFPDYWEHFFGMPYFILLNQTDHQLQKSLSPPLAVYQKPFKKEQVDEIFKTISSIQQLPNLSYAENISIGDPELLKELVLLLKTQLVTASEKIPYLYEQKNWKEFIQVVHKLISKFSILAMNDSFSFFNLTEKYLRDGFKLKPYAYDRLLTDLKTGIDFINHYIELNELHNS